MAKQENTKSAKARRIFEKLYPRYTRAEIIEEFIYSANLTPAGASTYYQKFKSEIDTINAEILRKRKAAEEEAEREKARQRHQEWWRTQENFRFYQRQHSASPKPVIKITWNQVLGVAIDASKEQIQSAWKKLAVAHHPDRNGGDHTKMAEINAARDEALRRFK